MVEKTIGMQERYKLEESKKGLILNYKKTIGCGARQICTKKYSKVGGQKKKKC